MFQRLYIRAALFLLPSVEDVINRIQAGLQALDRLTDRIERDLEAQVVALAKTARNRRLALDAINAAFDRRDDTFVARVDAQRDKLEKAAAARDKVAGLIEGLK